MLTTILLWHAIYRGAGKDLIANYRLNEMISYLLLVHISRMFSSMPSLARGIATDIRDGNLKKYLLQPIDMLNYLISYRIAHKMAYICMSALPYGLLFFICRHYLPPWPDTETTILYALALILGFVIGFHFEACMGMLGFWFLEVSSLLYVVGTLNYFLSGHMFPLDLLPESWVQLFKYLPFQYLAYFPAVIFLQKLSGEALYQALILEACWAVGLVCCSRLLFRIGLKRYSAFGG
ncbi:MAG: ABC-2 family transporter protein [Zavarzinella sp.]